jgi:hypothetical protein
MFEVELLQKNTLNYFLDVELGILILREFSAVVYTVLSVHSYNKTIESAICKCR